MSFRGARAGLVGASLLVAIGAGPSCAVRVGPGGPTVQDQPISACALSGAVKRLPFAVGSEAFAFVWDSDHYVVAYVNPTTGNGDIDVARLGPDGSLLGPPVAVEPTAASSDLPNLVQTAGGFLVVWQEGSAGTAVFAHALGPDAMPVGTGVTVAATQANQSRPVLARAPGGQVAVAWMDSFEGRGGVQVALIDPSSLAVTAPLRVAQGDNDGWPWIAGDDQSLGMAWSDEPGDAYDVRFARIETAAVYRPRHPSRSVAQRPAAAFCHASSGRASASSRPGKTCGRATTRSRWPSSTRRATKSAAVSSRSRTAATRTGPIWLGPGRPRASCTTSFERADRGIFMSFVDATGMRVGGLHDVQVSDAASGWSRYPDVVWTGTQFGVMYVDTRDGAPDLWLQSVGCAPAPALPTDASAPVTDASAPGIDTAAP